LGVKFNGEGYCAVFVVARNDACGVWPMEMAEQASLLGEIKYTANCWREQMNLWSDRKRMYLGILVQHAMAKVTEICLLRWFVKVAFKLRNEIQIIR
jgi:hypothetical protein